MSESIKERIQTRAPAVNSYDQRLLLEAILADLTALRAAIVAITAKLDADGGVTDTNYAATTNPAALTITS